MTATDIIITIAISIPTGILSSIIFETLKVWFPNLIPIKTPIINKTPKTTISKLWGILKYSLSLGSIAFFICLSIKTPNALNLFMLTYNLLVLIFSILMGHINTIYVMIKQLADTASFNDVTHGTAINILCKTIGIKEIVKMKE